MGETKLERIPAEKAYGPRRDDMVMEVDREQVPSEIELQLGQQLQVRQESGQAVPVDYYRPFGRHGNARREPSFSGQRPHVRD